MDFNRLLLRQLGCLYIRLVYDGRLPKVFDRDFNRSLRRSIALLLVIIFVNLESLFVYILNPIVHLHRLVLLLLVLYLFALLNLLLLTLDNRLVTTHLQPVVIHKLFELTVFLPVLSINFLNLSCLFPNTTL